MPQRDLPVVKDPAVDFVKRLEGEYALRDELDPGWAAQPLALARYRNRPALLLHA